MALGAYFKSAMRGVAAPKTGYSVPSQVIRDLFMAEPLLFRNMPELHNTMLIFLDMSDRAKSKEYQEKNFDLAKAYFTNPAQTIARSELGYNSDDRIAASPAVMYTRFKISEQREGFAVMLRDRLLSGSEYKKERNGSVKFAMAGYFDNDGQFTVERIKLPECFLNGRTQSMALKATPIDELSVNGALQYARLCTEQLFARTSFTPEYNFEQSLKDIHPDAALPIPVTAFKI